ncbi:MAG: hypothetical protein KDA84_15455 [Planctomycetaceae bacterium]|nr:hypothetical protein [Planctomycetaceae bacterium]
MNLPMDLVEFLSVGTQLEYDPDDCDAGVVTLLPLAELKLERFPVETSGQPFFKDDPNHPNVNSYLVLGVNLIASCDDYDPRGLLLWLPIEHRYAAWDDSHCTILVFGEQVTWDDIINNPVPYLEGSLGADGSDAPFESLVPWLSHPYGDEQVYEPQPI